MTCFLLPPKTSERYEEKEKACCDRFENAAGLSILLSKLSYSLTLTLMGNNRRKKSNSEAKTQIFFKLSSILKRL